MFAAAKYKMNKSNEATAPQHPAPFSFNAPRLCFKRIFYRVFAFLLSSWPPLSLCNSSHSLSPFSFIHQRDSIQHIMACWIL